MTKKGLVFAATLLSSALSSYAFVPGATPGVASRGEKLNNCFFFRNL